MARPVLLEESQWLEFQALGLKSKPSGSMPRKTLATVPIKFAERKIVHREGNDGRKFVCEMCLRQRG